MGQGVADGVDLATLAFGRHHWGGRRVVLHVVDARPDIDHGLEAGMGGDVADPLSINEDLAVVAERVAVFGPSTDHRVPLVVASMRAE
jgi:hypothetical protein